MSATSPTTTPDHVDVPVVVCGAGATGATLALLLARRGISSVVLDRRTTPLTHPAAHVINARTFEIWRDIDPGLADEVFALAPPIEDVNLIRWQSSFAASPIGHIDLASRPEQLDRVRSHSDYLVSHVGQHLLMPVLWSWLDREPLVEVRYGTSVAGISERDDSVVVHTSGAGGDGATLQARFAIGADGANSAVRDMVGVEMHGPTLAKMGSAFFRCDTLYPASERPLLTWIYQPNFAGVLIAHADHHYVLMGTYLHPAQRMSREPGPYWRDTLPAVLGADHAYDVVSTGKWEMTTQTADTFRRGRVLLAGDAAHRFPHTGGYGLNSGVQDAHNLAWKLEAVLSGVAKPTLLDTYEVERRPVVDLFARHSVANHFKLDDVTRHVGATNRMLQRATSAMSRPPFAWLPGSRAAALADRVVGLGLGRTQVIAGTGRRAVRARDKMASDIPGQLAHFVSTGLEFGYRYGGPLIDGRAVSAHDDGLDDVVEYRPRTDPVGRLPHSILSATGESALRSVGRDPNALTLVTFDADAWQAAVDKHRDDLSPLRVDVLDLGPAADAAPGTVDLYQVGERGALLVRADGHIVWRSTAGADDAADDAVATVRRLWGRYFPLDRAR
ncbi:2-polyprenyl-6-methoxyphenol hydroxylase [Rhodococcoides kroppenstedtii]|uniref:2-polyprenyl-6-methoxyphenol hydroxylase n=1 Tax=Rhodococcoides kroppenstedtii TaxID=293050 RepID=A0A1I0TPS3_9NOCA|nr:FAD-dependent monooxygenase [Rhodococcus kroppenstedtii]SFA53768.1 2-polyprenyl-6-methoxyphenol hydroxylase [Rhodococcus kroppenstedtii]